MLPVLSIIVPVYKVEPYLRQCIESILNQTFEEFELILIDDGSPDKCGAICDEYAARDSRIRVIHQENIGLCTARNLGIDLAQGQYLTFVDSDDWLQPEMYARLVTLADLYDADMTECGYVKVYDDGQAEKIEYDHSIKVVDGITALKAFKQGKYWHVVVWNKVYRRTLWEGIRFPVGKLHEDEYVTYKLYYKADKIVQIDTAMVNYRQRSDSFMGSGFNLKRFADAKEAYAEKEAFFRQEGVKSLEDLAAVEAVAYLMIAYIQMLKQKHLKAKARETKKEFNQKFKNLLQTSDPVLKDRLLFRLFYLSPSLYELYLRFEVARLVKQSKPARKVYERLISIKNKPYVKQRLKEIGKSKNLFLFMVPHHGNLGDQAIIYAQMQFAADHYPDYQVVQIMHRDTEASVKILKRVIKSEDIIWLPGGGNMGDVYLNEEQFRRHIISRFSGNQIVSFPQTIYFNHTKTGRRELKKSGKVYKKHPNLTLIARERVSYEVMQKEFPTCKILLMPDIVFYLTQARTGKERRGILICLRSDLEGVIALDEKLALLAALKKIYSDMTVTDTVLSREVGIDHREKELNELWDAFRAAKVVITDRLHGMIFAAITATPCVVFSNYNHKVQSSYQWLQGLDYIRFVDEFDQATVMQQVDELYRLDSQQLPCCDLNEAFKAIMD